MKTYFQCDLRQGDRRTVGYIEERGAKVGADVELKGAEFANVEMIEGDGNFWRVEAVYKPGISEAILRQKQANDRNALPSIIGKLG